MRVRPYIVVVAAVVLYAASVELAPPAAAGSIADVTAVASTGSVFIAVCADSVTAGPSAPDATVFLVDALSPLDALLSLPADCDGVFVVSPPVGEVLPDPRDVILQDAAVWSRGRQPVVRASDQP
jgi:hypothetical protein